MKVKLHEFKYSEKENEKKKTTNDLLPRTEKTLNNYIQAWQIWGKMGKEYEEDILGGHSKQKKPKMEDFRDRVIAEMNWNVGIKTLSNVISLGKAGLLKKKKK